MLGARKHQALRNRETLPNSKPDAFRALDDGRTLGPDDRGPRPVTSGGTIGRAAIDHPSSRMAAKPPSTVALHMGHILYAIRPGLRNAAL